MPQMKGLYATFSSWNIAHSTLNIQHSPFTTHFHAGFISILSPLRTISPSSSQVIIMARFRGYSSKQFLFHILTFCGKSTNFIRYYKIKIAFFIRRQRINQSNASYLMFTFFAIHYYKEYAYKSTIIISDRHNKYSYI